MKNTYLIAILFLIAGLVLGQFLNLNISGQSARVIDSKSFFNEQMIKSNYKQLQDSPDASNRAYFCMGAHGGWGVFGLNGDDGGWYSNGGILWSCGALDGTWA